jgi:hypothetical protein
VSLTQRVKEMTSIFKRFWNWLTRNKEQTRYASKIYLVRRPNHKDLPKFRAVNAQIWTSEKISQEDMKYELLRWSQDNLPEYYQPSEDFSTFYTEKIDRKQAKRLGLDDEKYHISSEPLPEDEPSPKNEVEEEEPNPVKQEDRLELRL